MNNCRYELSMLLTDNLYIARLVMIVCNQSVTVSVLEEYIRESRYDAPRFADPGGAAAVFVIFYTSGCGLKR